MKKNALIAAIAFASIGHTVHAQEADNVACMSEPQRVEVNVRSFDYVCDAVNGGEAKLSTRLNSSFASYFVDGIRKAQVRSLGDENTIRTFSRRNVTFTDVDAALLDELIAAYEADNGEESSQPANERTTSVSSAIGSSSSNADTNETSNESTLVGNASVDSMTNTNGQVENVSADSSSASAPVAVPAPSPAPTRSPTGADVFITFDSADDTLNVDTDLRGNGSLNGTVSGGSNTVNVSERISSLMAELDENDDGQDASSNTTRTFNQSSSSTGSRAVFSASASENGDVDVDGETEGNASGGGFAQGGDNSESLSR